MNKDQVSGKVDQAVGKAKQGIGNVVGDQNLANRGVVDQANGAAKETWGDAKDTAHEIANDHKKHVEAHAAETRNSVSRSIDNMKERAQDNIDAVKEEHREHEKHQPV